VARRPRLSRRPRVRQVLPAHVVEKTAA
jgi:hypothetical protein